MNNIDGIHATTEGLAQFATGYFSYLSTVLSSVDDAVVDALGEFLLDARERNATIFIAGNGGSASTATTMANDLGSDVMRKTGTDRPLRMLALTDNNSVLTAVANDTGYENVFLYQLRIHYRPGDVLLVISASGNSPNVVQATEWVHTQGGKVAGLLGFSGGKLKDMCDVALHFKTEAGEYGPVEDAHLVVNHILAHWLQRNLKP
jgi:D-sedoheptulose 7-phosphate isomerase